MGCAAFACAVVSYSVAEAQQTEPLPQEELPAGVVDAGDFAPPGWTGGGEHPGKADFDQFCRLCHHLTDQVNIGPGLAGVYSRVEAGPPYEGKPVQARLLEFIRSADQADPDKIKDPYFRKMVDDNAGSGVQMTALGGLPADSDDRRILNVIDYFLRYRDIAFNEGEYLRRVKVGRELVSGQAPFTYGAPACASCHSVGADQKLLGANIGPNIGHTYVLARQLGVDDKANFADGLYQLLSGENAPVAHNYYKDVAGGGPLTETELLLVTTYFEQAARDTGTEHTSNYLPIFALLLAALCILLLEPGVLNVLFAREHGPEYLDGPYKEEEHHHDDHHEESHTASHTAEKQEPGAPATGSGSPVPEAAASTPAPAAESAAEDLKPAEMQPEAAEPEAPKSEDTTSENKPDETSSETKPDESK